MPLPPRTPGAVWPTEPSAGDVPPLPIVDKLKDLLSMKENLSESEFTQVLEAGQTVRRIVSALCLKISSLEHEIQSEVNPAREPLNASTT